ncbi:hypothetical protein [Aquibacillus albus]|uniref:Uncharacterized protein n=1 Tax=Aquibacillus albus TaxID=1168171 RepID=A0ABS2MV18_9BACI|nr:hypothetical protein [Aquibacillus albus]MBM7569741.1 hypothetical protein [Aquibacillus albus]
MIQKKKIKDHMINSLGDVDIRELEHQITYPGQQEFNLRNVSFTPGENEYLNGNGEEKFDG